MTTYKKKNFYRINWQIRADLVRLIDEKGGQIGVFSLAEAQKMAKDKNLDLVEIAPQAKPPVVKLIALDKFKYQLAKKEKEERKKQSSGQKELRLTPFIAEADLNFRLKKIKEYLKKGLLVKLIIQFKGRQITQKSFGYDLLEKIMNDLGETAEIQTKPKFVNNRLITNIKPKK